MPKKKSTSKNITEAFTGPRSYRNLLYGVITVIVLFIVIFFGLKALSGREGNITEEAQETTKEEQTYTVKAGDSLWSIAEQEYNDGYQWVKIAEENKLESPDAIDEGMTLVIPTVTEETKEATDQATMKEETATESAAPATGSITGKEYTIVEGDNLWDIAIRAYGDGYKWTEISNANKLANPDLIYPGNKLSIPR